MKITYDVEYLPERSRSGKKSEEVLAVITFLASQHKNMCFEYDDEAECKRKYNTVRGYKKSHELQNVFDVYRKEKRFYVIKLKKSGKKGAVS